MRIGHERKKYKGKILEFDVLGKMRYNLIEL